MSKAEKSATGAIEETEPAAEPDWRLAAAAGDDKIAKALESVTDVPALAASYASLRSAVSSGRFANKIVIPDAEAPAWARFREQLPADMRAPETAGDYQLTHPDWVGEAQQNALAGFVAAMHGTGATESQVQTALDHHYELVAQGKAMQEAADTQYLQESEAMLRQEWGEAYERNLAMAERAITALFGEASDIAQFALKNGRLLGSLPEFARGMAQVGRMMSEDPLVGLDGDGGQDLQGQIDAITAEGMRDGNYYSESVQQKLRPLYEKLHGGAPIRV